MPIKTVAFDTPTDITKVNVVISDIETELTKVHVVIGGVPTTVFTTIPIDSMEIPSLVVLSDSTSSITFRMTNNELVGTGADAYFYYEIWNDAETVRIDNANTILDSGIAPQGTIDKSFGGLSSDTYYKLRAYAEDVLGIKIDSSFSDFVREKTDNGVAQMVTPTLGNAFSITDTSANVNITNEDTSTGNANASVPGGSATEPTGIAGLGGTKTISITGLEPGTSYTLTASMSDAAAIKTTSNSTQRGFITTGLPKLSTPTNLRTEIVSGTEINFLWNAVTNADDYRVESPDGSIDITSSTSISADRLEAGTFRVVARASGYEDSDEATLSYTPV
jgi:hypothetical protein